MEKIQQQLVLVMMVLGLILGKSNALNQRIKLTGPTNVTGQITASGDISSSGKVYGQTIIANQYGGDISGSVTSTGSFGRLEVTGTGSFQSGMILPATARIQFDSKDTYIEASTDGNENLEIHADGDIELKPDNDLEIRSVSGQMRFSGTNARLELDSNTFGNVQDSEIRFARQGVIVWSMGNESADPYGFKLNSGTGLGTGTDGSDFHFSSGGDLTAQGWIESKEYVLAGQYLEAGSYISASGAITSSGAKIVGDISASGNIDIQGGISASANIHLADGKEIYFGEFDAQKQSIRGGNGYITIDADDVFTIQADSYGNITKKFGINRGTSEPPKALTVTGDISASGNFYLEQTASIQYRHFDTGSSTLSSVGGSMGDIVKFGQASGLTPGSIYVLNTSGTWTAADADTGGDTTGSLAVALGASATNDGMLLRGMTKLGHDPGGDIGNPLFVSTNAGSASNSAPGSEKFVRVIGYNMDTSGLIYFNPDNTWVEVS